MGSKERILQSIREDAAKDLKELEWSQDEVETIQELTWNAATNEKTKQQRELIERLAEIVKNYIDDRKGVAGLTPVGTDMYNDLHQQIKEAESLLKETD